MTVIYPIDHPTQRMPKSPDKRPSVDSYDYLRQSSQHYFSPLAVSDLISAGGFADNFRIDRELQMAETFADFLDKAVHGSGGLFAVLKKTADDTGRQMGTGTYYRIRDDPEPWTYDAPGRSRRGNASRLATALGYASWAALIAAWGGAPREEQEDDENLPAILKPADFRKQIARVVGKSLTAEELNRLEELMQQRRAASTSRSEERDAAARKQEKRSQRGR